VRAASPGRARPEWADVNGDGRPELIAWLKAKNDTLFDECSDCPFIIHERTFTESHDGLSLHDMRIFPSPYATFTLFVRLLSEGNREAAKRLLANPAKLAEAEPQPGARASAPRRGTSSTARRSAGRDGSRSCIMVRPATRAISFTSSSRRGGGSSATG
jgi:hypothetical protein